MIEHIIKHINHILQFLNILSPKIFYVFKKILNGCILLFGGSMKRKLNINGILIILIILSIAIFLSIYLLVPNKNSNQEEKIMINLINKTAQEAQEFANNNKLNLIVKENNNTYEKGKIYYQSIIKDSKIIENQELIIYVSKGIDYESLKVNELGNVPIMMYHGIQDIENKYTGGNIDIDGYQRTKKAFEQDLEFYYQNGYRMIRLQDYVNGKIDVEAGFSPIILTFDDGLSNNIKVTGLDDDGNIIIDPNSAVGILESFKKKYPNFNITATFFVNGGLFQQREYNEQILNWLVNNGYDIGNHSYSHVDFTTVSKEKSVQEIGSLYNLLDKYIPGKYVNIVALPFGSPYNKTHNNFSAILNGIYNSKEYKTISTLRVGWEADYSPFSYSFDKNFLKRIRAYDNLGKEFDIEMNFKILENNRYISDGNVNTITVPKSLEEKINNIYDLDINTY